MDDRARIRVGAAGAILAAICCAAPLLVVGLPLAGVGAWPAGVGLAMLPLILAALGLVAWGVHHRQATAAAHETEIHREGVKP